MALLALDSLDPQYESFCSDGESPRKNLPGALTRTRRCPVGTVCSPGYCLIVSTPRSSRVRAAGGIASARRRALAQARAAPCLVARAHGQEFLFGQELLFAMVNILPSRDGVWGGGRTQGNGAGVVAREQGIPFAR